MAAIMGRKGSSTPTTIRITLNTATTPLAPSETESPKPGRASSVSIAFGVFALGPDLPGVNGRGVRELRDRLRAAVLSSGLEWPNGRITVRAGTLRSDGSWPASLDLAAAAAVLAASGQIPASNVSGCGFVGELGLDGTVERSSGGARAAEVLSWVGPVVTDPRTAGCIEDPDQARAAASLAAMSAAFNGTREWARTAPLSAGEVPWPPHGDPRLGRAAIVAAAGGHHMLAVGHDTAAVDDIGAAVTALQHTAQRRPLVADQVDSVAVVHSLGDVAPRILSELVPSLGNPIMSDAADDARAGGGLVLIGAMQPDPGPTATNAVRGLSWLPGELLDRFDLRVRTAPDAAQDRPVPQPTLAAAQETVAAARAAAASRGARRNASLSPQQLADAAPLTEEGRRLLSDAMVAGSLTAAGAFAVCRVALTLCDVDGTDPVLGARHVAEALEWRANVATLCQHRQLPHRQRRSTLGR